MKENIKKWIALIMATLILFCMMYSCGKVVNAEVPSNQLVVKNSSTWNNYQFQYFGSNSYYTIQDATGVPDGTLLNPYYFYTKDGTTFFALDGLKTFTNILNLGIGLVVDNNTLDSIFTGFFTAINITDSTNNKYVQNGLYDLNDNFLGYCLNDISGCYWNDIVIPEDSVTIPNNEVKNVKNYYDTLGSAPDWFTFYGFSTDYVMDRLLTSLNATKKQLYDSNQVNYELLLGVGYWVPDYFNLLTTSTYNSNNNGFDGFNSVSYALCQNDNMWNNFCNYYGITENELLSTEIQNLKNVNISSTYNFEYKLYDSSEQQITSATRLDLNNSSVGTITFDSWYFGSTSGAWRIPYKGNLTFYKNAIVKNGLDTQTYNPDIYTTDKFNNFNQEIDNSYNTTVYQINQSTTYNQSIYQDSNDSFYDYYDNGYVNTENVTNNVTTITNNYYSGENDNPANPDNPDNPDDNKTLDEILAAILRFFNAIGDIIGTVLAGLVNMISAVLESISELTSDITNLSDLFESLLAWIPDPVPQVIGIGLSLVIIAGVIKFIRG